VKRLLFLGLILGLLSGLSGAFADVNYFVSGTTHYVNNSVVGFSVNTANNQGLPTLWVYNGTWNDLTDFMVQYLNSSWFYTSSGVSTVSVLENTTSRVVLSWVTPYGISYNLSLSDGATYFHMINTSDVNAQFGNYEIVRWRFLEGVSADWYVYYPDQEGFYSAGNIMGSRLVPVNSSLSADTRVYSVNESNYLIAYNPFINQSFYLAWLKDSEALAGFRIQLGSNNLYTFWSDLCNDDNTGFIIGSLPNLDVSTISGNVATAYSWNNYTFTNKAPVDYVRYWDFNEAGGTSADDLSSDDKDLTLSDATDWVHGKQSWGFHYDGSSDYAESSDLTSITDDTTGSICYWYKLDNDLSSNENTFAISDASSNAQTYLIQTYADGINIILFKLAIDGTTQWQINSESYGDWSAWVGKWTQVCIVQDGVAPTVFINGVNKSSWGFATSTDTTVWIADLTGATNVADTITVGAWANNNGHERYADGSIDDVIIYSRNLSSAEIGYLYGTGLPDSFSSLSATYNGLTTTTNFYELMSNLSYRTATYSDNNIYLGTNSNYTSRVYNYGSIANDFSITPNYFMTLSNDSYNHVPIDYNLSIPSANGEELLLITSSEIGSWNYTTHNYPVIGVNSLNCSVGCANTTVFNFKDEVTLNVTSGTFTSSIVYSGGVYGLDTVNESETQVFTMFPYYGVLNYSQVHLDYSGGSYDPRDYYLFDGYLDNSSDTITLYMISGGADVTFTILNNDNQYITNATVQALKYYDDEDAYRLVTSGTTDDYGKTVLDLDIGEWYRIIIITETDTIVKKMYIDSTSQTIIINPDTVELWFNHTDGASATFVFDNVTNWSYVYVIDDSGLMNNATLVIEDITLGSESQVCNVANFTAGSFYVFCYLGNDTTDRIYHVYSRVEFSDGFNQTIYNDYLFTGSTVGYGVNGLIISFLIIMLFAFAGAVNGAKGALIFIFIGLIVVVMANFFAMGWGALGVAGVIIFVLFLFGGRDRG